MASIKAMEAELSALEQRVAELLKVCKRLNEENHSLKNSQDQLVNERADLVAKQEQARARVEAMINRLKALEQES
jgi:cell division protein ZapB